MVPDERVLRLRHGEQLRVDSLCGKTEVLESIFHTATKESMGSDSEHHGASTARFDGGHLSEVPKWLTLAREDIN